MAYELATAAPSVYMFPALVISAFPFTISTAIGAVPPLEIDPVLVFVSLFMPLVTGVP